MSETQGKRIPDQESNIPANQGEYGKVGSVWWAKVPAPGFPSASLVDHEVIEHSDGTISVSPSILIENGRGDKQWHGYLVGGVWREV